MKCNWTNYDEDCKYCFDRHCTLPSSDLEDKPNDAECKNDIKTTLQEAIKKEIEYEYRKYASRQVKKLERDYR